MSAIGAEIDAESARVPRDRQPTRVRRRSTPPTTATTAGFEEITRRARERFERRDWRGAQADATERLALYRTHVDGAVADVRDILQDAVMERTLWAAMRGAARRAALRRPARRRAGADLLQLGHPAGVQHRGRGRRHRVPRPVARARRIRGRAAAVRHATGVDDGGRRAGPPHPRALPVVGALRLSSSATRRSWPRLITDGARRACRDRGPDRARRAALGVLPEQGRLPGRPDPARRRDRSRWCSRCSTPSAASWWTPC